MSWIRLEPLYQERVWGGRNLESFLRRKLPQDKVIGESWEIVDRPEAQSKFESGVTLRTLIERESAHIMGPEWDPQRPFPILVKWLDCQARLSLQVHPPASIAPELGGEPKTENWYIADAKEDAALILGLKHGVTQDAFEAGIETTSLEPLLHRIPSKPGDSVLVESGRLHAIDAGNLILEIQQNSDTTYRVYDWGRVGLDGKPRTLHLEESIKSIDFNDFEPDTLKHRSGDHVLADCAEFRIRKFEMNAESEPLNIAANQQARMLHVVEGEVIDSLSEGIARKGDNLILPYGAAFELSSKGNSTFLMTDNFS